MAIRAVVDSNFLASPELDAYLKASAENFVVVTDYIWMEAYKARSIPVLRKSLSIIGKFSEQTIFLRGTKYVSGLDYRSPGVARRMEWRRVRKDFKETIRKLENLHDDRHSASFPSNELVVAAEAHLDGKMLKSIEGFTPVFRDISNLFLSDEISWIRSGKAITVPIAKKIFWIAGDLSRGMMAGQPGRIRGLSRKSEVNSFSFRYALSNVLYLVQWIRHGSPMTVADSKLRNDQVDIILGVYGSYFNGVMSHDQKMLDRATELRVVLRILGARVPKDWDELLTRDEP